MTTAEYLDALKARLHLPSDYALRGWLDVTSGAMRHYRRGRAHFEDAVALRVAFLLDAPPAQVLADMYAQRAHAADVRNAWRKIAESAA